ncbi:MAG: hypothetical protein JNJ60_23790, partial [Rhodocyclaceae bacterium]|nr:hypothetical protein [Rhodocyclaceae bacterium]
EELLISADPRPTSHPRIMIAHETCLPWDELMPALQALDAALAANDAGQIRLRLGQLVAGYAPAGGIVDWVYMEQHAAAGAARNGN